MKMDSNTHINDWKFGEHKEVGFIEKFDIFIIILVFLIAYFIIF